MQHKISVTLLGNQGIIMEGCGMRLLADGLHTGAPEVSFSGIHPPVLADMLAGRGEYANLDCLLFTHRHVDHYNVSLATQYLQHNRVQGVFLPRDDSPKITDFADALATAHVPTEHMHLPMGETRSVWLSPEVCVTYARIRHAGAKYKDVPHYALHIRMGNATFLLAGDADYDDATFARLAGHLPLTAMFVNFLYTNAAAGRRILSQRQPQHIVVYHLPFKADDHSGYRHTAASDAKKYATTLLPITLLQQPLQRLEF